MSDRFFAFPGLCCHKEVEMQDPNSERDNLKVPTAKTQPLIKLVNHTRIPVILTHRTLWYMAAWNGKQRARLANTPSKWWNAHRQIRRWNMVRYFAEAVVLVNNIGRKAVNLNTALRLFQSGLSKMHFWALNWPDVLSFVWAEARSWAGAGEKQSR